MSKTITLQLTEAEYRELILCYTLGDLVKESIEHKSEAETEAQIDLHQKLYKSAYDAELKESGWRDGLYYYGRKIEDKMLSLYDDFKEYISSGEEEREMQGIRQHIENLEKKKK